VTKPEIIICPDAQALARLGAEQFTANGAEAISRSGRFAVALSGGSTPAALYRLLASPEFRERVDWSRVHFFWGDERCVPPDHQDSNFRMTRETLLDAIQAPSENIHRIVGELEPAAAAAGYEAELRRFFGAQIPRFELVLLGLGEDGHTASLFPNSSALDERQRWVAATYVQKLRSHRVTLTVPVLNAAAQVVFLVAGASKAEIVKEILRPDRDPSLFPAARIQPSNGILTWLISEDAATALPADLPARRDRSRPVPTDQEV
jgi:6-phosphogluconolactonase